jgi:hypothetical protein
MLFRSLVTIIALTSAAAPVAAVADPLEDFNIGLVLTIEGPATFRPGDPVRVSGHLRAQVGLPIVFETAHGVPAQEITVYVGEEPVGTTETDTTGAWSLDLSFDHEMPYTREVRASAFTGTPLVETSSRTIEIRRELIFIGLRIDPGSIEIVPNGGVALQALAEDDQGRDNDVSEQALWSSSDTDVATVSNATGERGLTMGVSPGSAMITVTYEDFVATATVLVD